MTDPSAQGHTPGPWEEGPSRTVIGPDLGGRRGREIIADGVHPANASLIASAPALAEENARLREAVEKIVEKCRQYANAPQLCVEEQHAVNEWIERQARSALPADAVGKKQ